MNLIWVAIFIILLVIELATINLVTIWFAIGSILAFLTSFLTDSWLIQSTIFVISSAIIFLIMKKLLKKNEIKTNPRTNLDRVIGKIGLVTEGITDMEIGEVKIDGKRWSAISKEKIDVGEKVKILSIDGVKLNVQKWKEVN